MRATTSLLAGLAILLGASAPGLGAGNTGAAPPDPATFVETAAQDGLTEMKLGALAQQKGKSADVRAFGARMVTDHGKANEELQAIAKPKGLKVPAALDAKHRAMVEELSAKSGTDFDAAYAKHMSLDHAKAVALFSQASNGSDKELAAFAKKTLPVLQEHKKLADSLSADPAGAAKPR